MGRHRRNTGVTYLRPWCHELEEGLIVNMNRDDSKYPDRPHNSSLSVFVVQASERQLASMLIDFTARSYW